ncbi:efflux RND transporter permease subunit [Tellurirhabdus rosea]|uniref:efflux RND transporter permease subunit n=1 Tax=Tellurirhabdus rosea TaxID=2674997 RepID=UPI00225951AB|nr:MMPL family transporter [Tellurirhabdus rosea]
MVWHRISAFVLKNRPLLLIIILLGTIFMGYQASQIRLSYELAKILPTSDPDFIEYEAFKARYGEDGNVMVIGAETPAMYQLRNFNGWYDLNQQLRKIDGIRDVVSNASLFRIVRNDSTGQFNFLPLVPQKPTTQVEVDSIRRSIAALPFYDGFVSDSAGQAHLMAVTFKQDALNTKGRIAIVRQIAAAAKSFEKAYNIPVHLSGMPFIRTEFTAKVSNEMIMFMGLAFVVTALILLMFFRSLLVVLISGIVVGIGVIWSTGYMVLFGYKITLLTGLIPPLIIVIGIPNAIFLLNTYHNELSRHGEKMRALKLAAEKIGETTFFANVTTSIGFFVFYFTNSPLLLEFGLVAALGIMTTFAISLILITIAFSYLPAPSEKQRGHLEGRRINAFLRWVDHLVHQRRVAIYTFIGVAVVIGVIGMLRIKAVGYVVDDLPKNDPIYTDLKFFEGHFRGVMPFEVNVDTRQPGRVLNPQTLTKIRLLQREIEKYPEFTRPLSIVEAVKFFYQGYRGGDPKYYILPPAMELAKLANYAPQASKQQSRLNGFLDSTRRYTRVSFQMADVGTARINELLAKLQPKADSIFNIDRETGQRLPPGEQYDVRITGSSVVFTKGNDYLLYNLQESTALAIVLVSIILGLLLRDLRSVLIAVLPSVVPLLITAGIMGYFNIYLKPSTILIFSIAFGISSDGTIYFITKYRDELRTHGLSISEAVSRTIRHTGVSMVYTAFILFVGFAIFTASTFQGTVTLGLLVSITLLMGMASNLILLPAFLMSLDKRRKRKRVMS